MTVTMEKPRRTASKKQSRKVDPTVEKHIIKTYPYWDENRSELLYECVRFDPKSFAYRRPNPQNSPDLKHRIDPNDPEDQKHWIWGLDKTRRVLYRLPDILNQATIALRKPIFICEGEKDADSLYEIDLIATTSPMGAKGWQDEYSKFLSDYDSIVILPHNDKPGKDYAKKVTKSLTEAEIKEIRIIELPGLLEHGDVTDWLNGDGSRQKLLTLVKDRLPIVADTETETDLPPETFLPTDTYNATRFVQRYGDKVRYCWNVGWLLYDGKRWNRDTGQAAAEKFVRQTAQSLYGLLRKTRSKADGDEIYKHFIRSQNDRKLQAALNVARSYDEISIYAKDLDSDPYLFNCDNGTIDLRTGEFRAHRPADMITKLAPVTYDPKARCPLWLSDLDTWHKKNPEIIDYLGQVMGMCLTGDISAQVFPIFHGSGKNGKSVFIDTILGLMGDYASEAPEDLLSEKREQGHSTEIAALAGQRLVVADETQEYMKLRTSLIKKSTGSKKLRARFVHKDSFEFEITHKTILITQHLPRITETADAIWRRLRLFDWSYRITDEEEIPKTELLNRLKAEWPGILNWLLEGCRKWQKENPFLRAPESIKAITEQYQKDSDILSDFIDEKLLLNMPVESRPIPKVEVYQLFRKWATEHEIDHPISMRKFTEQLRIKNVRDGQERIEGKNVKVWYGMGLQE